MKMVNVHLVHLWVRVRRRLGQHANNNNNIIRCVTADVANWIRFSESHSVFAGSWMHYMCVCMKRESKCNFGISYGVDTITTFKSYWLFALTAMRTNRTLLFSPSEVVRLNSIITFPLFFLCGLTLNSFW